MTLSRLALVLRAGLHSGERQTPGPAVQLSLLQHLVGDGGPRENQLLPSYLGQCSRVESL